MYENILVPLDGSSLAQAVLTPVRVLAKGLGSRLLLLHVVEAAVEARDAKTQAKVAEAVRQARNAAQRYLDDQAVPLREEGIHVETAILEGRPHQRIVEYAEEQKVGLTAMSTHGRAGIGRAVLGSIASRVLQTGESPLLLVTPRHTGDLWVGPDRLERILVPLDGSKTAAAALPYAEDLARRLKMSLTLMQALYLDLVIAADPYGAGPWSIPWEEIQQLEAETKDYLEGLGQGLLHRGIQADWRVVRGRAAQAIVQEANSIIGPLIVMTTHGRSGLQRWMLGSVADEVIRETGAPVLVIRRPWEEA